MDKRYTTSINRTNRLDTPHDFHATDKRGRAIGANVYTFESDFVLSPETAMGGYTLEPGHYFCFQPHTTRNGNTYGPVQPTQYFATPEERGVAIAKYLASAAKRIYKS